MEHWEAHFRFYDKFQMAYSKYRAMLDFHRNTLRECHSVLDSGAGTGNLTLQLLKEGHKVVAVDYNRNALDSLRKKCQEYKNQLQTQEVDLETELPFSENYFDGVASSFVIPFVNNIKGYLSENYRVLKKGGILSLSVPLPIQGVMDYVMGNLEKEAESKGLLPEYKTEWGKIWETSRINEKTILKNGLPELEIIKTLEDIGFSVKKSKNKPYDNYVSLLICVK